MALAETFKLKMLESGETGMGVYIVGPLFFEEHAFLARFNAK